MGSSRGHAHAHAECAVGGMHLRKRLGRSALVGVVLHCPLQVRTSACHTLKFQFLMRCETEEFTEMAAHDSLHDSEWPHSLHDLFEKTGTNLEADRCLDGLY